MFFSLSASSGLNIPAVVSIDLESTRRFGEAKCLAFKDVGKEQEKRQEKQVHPEVLIPLIIVYQYL